MDLCCLKGIEETRFFTACCSSHSWGVHGAGCSWRVFLVQRKWGIPLHPFFQHPRAWLVRGTGRDLLSNPGHRALWTSWICQKAPKDEAAAPVNPPRQTGETLGRRRLLWGREEASQRTAGAGQRSDPPLISLPTGCQQAGRRGAAKIKKSKWFFCLFVCFT